jgi:D-beta-D-heptose 7-phosphate kinase/D-beta-D-heptose 1-phosphate adenosyltransferase
MKNTTWNKNWRKSVIIMSGGFDPVHKGHLRMFREASWLGHQVIVGLNSDDWLTRKKGQPFMDFKERKEILEGFKYVNQVLAFDDSDDTACKLIGQVRTIYNGQGFNYNYLDSNPTGESEYTLYFANGGDRTTDNTPEMKTCEKMEVEMLWGIGGGKIQSSSWLTGGKQEFI